MSALRLESAITSRIDDRRREGRLPLLTLRRGIQLIQNQTLILDQRGWQSESRHNLIQKQESAFQAYWSATKRYAELTKADALIHKSVAAAVHGLRR
jgi:hypothetical protein